MTAQTRAVNKSRFENGDKPQGSDFADLIDSFVAIADTTAQAIQSNLQVVSLIATSVTAGSVVASAATVTGILSAASVTVSGAVTAASITVTGDVSANKVFSSAAAIGLVSADNVIASAATFQSVTVSAARINGSLTFEAAMSTASASAGGGAALPASVAGYLIATVSGVTGTVRIPYYKA